MTEAFVRNPVKVAVGVILVMMFGIIALRTMPIALTPEVQTPTLTIETHWPGASPQEVEKEIVQEQEEQLQSVEGVRKMSSESMDSTGKIVLEFAVGTDMNQALLLVNTRLSQVREYPENADEPVISTSNSSDSPIAWFVLAPRPPSDEKLAAFAAQHPQLASEVDSIRKAANAGLALFRTRSLAKKHAEAEVLLPKCGDVETMRRFAEDNIEARFERVDGVSNSNVIGGREDELQIIVDAQRLAARQITIADVRDALRANIDTSGGDFWEGKRRYVVRTLGESRDVRQVENTIIARRDDGPVYVRDVARVQLGHKKPSGLVKRYGTSIMAVNVLRENGTNVLEINDGLQKVAKQLNDGILKPRDLLLSQVYDETEYIHASIDLVWENLWEGGVLTFIALMVFLRSFRSSLVVFVSIIVSTFGMFLVMKLMGRSLNVPSLAGIAFAVGMLVDNFIVVLENIFRRHQSGETALTATVRGAQEVSGAIVASTLANLAVFIPVLFVQDEAGQLFRDIALATASALALSLLVSLILVPMATSRVLPKRKETTHSAEHPHGYHWHKSDQAAIVEAPTPVGARVGAFFNNLLRPVDTFGNGFITLVVAINAWIQRGLIRQIVVAAGFMVGALGLSYLMLPKVEYLPNGNRNLTIGILLPPPGYNLDQITKMGQLIETELKPYWDVDPDSPDAAKLPYPAIADFFFVAQGRQLFLGVRSQDPTRAGELVQLLQSLGPRLPGTILVAFQTSLFERGLSAGRTVEVEITGPDVEKLVGLGYQVLGKSMQVVPGAQVRPVPSLDLSSPEIHVTPKWEQSADMGVTAAELGYAVDALVDGAYAGDFYLAGEKIDMTIQGSDHFDAQSQDMPALFLATRNGQAVPLAALADIRLASGMEQINRRERQRAISINVTPPPDIPLEGAMDAIQQQIVKPIEDSGQLGSDYHINFSGTADKLKTTWESLRWNLLLALVITYLVMSALFESWVYPFIIILSVPLGAVGGFAGLQLLNLAGIPQPLDVLTMLGFIILVGTVVNNPILIVEQALVHIREEGMAPQRAILESVRTRIRPIFMTALIGLFGLLPLVISPGAGSELYRGLGAVLLGGLVASTVFTLVFVPTVFNLSMLIGIGLTNLNARFRPKPPLYRGDRNGDATGPGSESTAPGDADTPARRERHLGVVS